MSARQNERGKHGAKTSLAAAAGCQLSHLSQVLSGHVHITTEQAYGMAAFWKFDVDATEFFMALVQRERSASQELTDYLTKKISLIRDRKRKLSEQVKTQKIIHAKDISRYYASWLYPAIHMLVTIEQFQLITALTSKLKVHPETISNVVEDLQNMGLVKRDGSKVLPVSQNIHIESGARKAHPLYIALHDVRGGLSKAKADDPCFHSRDQGRRGAVSRGVCLVLWL